MRHDAAPTLAGTGQRPDLAQISTTCAPARRKRCAITAGVVTAGIALFVFLLLTRLFLVYPGTLVTEHNDVLFGTDIGVRWKDLSGESPVQTSVSHFLLRSFWGNLGKGLARILEVVLPTKQAKIYAATILVCTMAAFGVGCLVAIAMHFADRKINVVLLVPVCLCFTANALIIVPDHLGISFGLLAASSAILLPNISFGKKLLLLPILGFLLAVTTITNALFALFVGIAVFWGQPFRRFVCQWRRVLTTAGMALALGSCLFGIWRWEKFKHSDTIIHRFINWRIVRDPLAAAQYSGYGLLFPAVGPQPIVNVTRDVGTLDDHISLAYNGTGLSDYSRLGAIAASVWAILLVVSITQLTRQTPIRIYGAVLLSWIAFNLVFHNIWGDEFFFYSAHWSWALMLIVLLGSNWMPTWAVAGAVLLVLPGQLETLYAIRGLLVA
jgi:hypothetical protein